MPNKAAFDRLSRLKNHGEPCPRCNRPIERLFDHLDAHGRPICQFMSAYDRELERLRLIFQDDPET
jgi:hypothetical protein